MTAAGARVHEQPGGGVMRVQVELDDDGELLIHALGCRTADPDLVVPLLATAVIAAIQRCRAGQPMPVSGPSPTERLHERIRVLDAQLAAAAAAGERADRDRSTLRAQLTAAERREGALRVRHDTLADRAERDQRAHAELAAGWPEKLRAVEDAGAAASARAAQLEARNTALRTERAEAREQTRAVRAELAAAAARAEQAETALAAARTAVAGQDVQRRVALALLDEGRSPDEVAALVGASAGLVRRWEDAGA